MPKPRIPSRFLASLVIAWLSYLFTTRANSLNFVRRIAFFERSSSHVPTRSNPIPHKIPGWKLPSKTIEEDSSDVLSQTYVLYGFAVALLL